MRTHRATLILAGAALSVGLALGAARGAGTGQAAGLQQAIDSTCLSYVASVVTPADHPTICQQLNVQVSVEPSCPVCSGGTNIVFVEAGQAQEPAWMKREAERALDELITYNGRFKLQVGVVHYFAAYATISQNFTGDMDSVRSALKKPTDGNIIGQLYPGTQMAVAMLKSARLQAAPNAPRPCEIVVVFGASSPTCT